MSSFHLKISQDIQKDKKIWHIPRTKNSNRNYSEKRPDGRFIIKDFKRSILRYLKKKENHRKR